MFSSKIRHYLKERRHKYDKSEAAIFAHLLTSVKSDEVISIDRQYRLWLLAVAPELTRGGISTIATIQPSFADVLKALDLAMIDRAKEFDRISFMREVKIFREKLLQEKQSIQQGLPLTVNP